METFLDNKIKMAFEQVNNYVEVERNYQGLHLQKGHNFSLKRPFSKLRGHVVTVKFFGENKTRKIQIESNFLICTDYTFSLFLNCLTLRFKTFLPLDG